MSQEHVSVSTSEGSEDGGEGQLGQTPKLVSVIHRRCISR